ncbi:MAG: hypothetical protein II287_02345 [Bacteroidaceae bacterium]|nr:hypothetical protein [Bacteroidaceae bacterium]
MEFNNNAEDQAINGRENNIAEVAVHNALEEFLKAKAEVEEPQQEENNNSIFAILGGGEENPNRRTWADLNLGKSRVQVFQDSFTCKLKLPKNLNRKQYYESVSTFAKFLKRIGKYMFNNNVLTAQTKDDADQAMFASWCDYVDAWFEMKRKYEQQFIAQQEEAPQEGLEINDNIELL